MNALRAFEAVARTGSIAAAADELSVTPGAVAQHIKSLEAWAGRNLFRRHARGLSLTDLAQELLPKFEQAFDLLSDAVQDLRHAAAPENLSIAALPSVAEIWLPNRITRLRESAPEVSISVFAFETPPNLGREPFDINIFFQDGPPEPYQVTVGRDRIYPVATPSVAEQVATHNDLLNLPMIVDATWANDWNIWAKSAGLDLPLRPRGPTYSLYSLALRAALDGVGVLMGHEALVQDQMDSGELVRLSPATVELDRHLVVEVAPGVANSAAIRKVKQALFRA